MPLVQPAELVRRLLAAHSRVREKVPPIPELPWARMRIGVIDIGSNTIRLLVARLEGGELLPVTKGRYRLSLGEEIERTGVVSDLSIAAAEKAVAKLCGTAREEGVQTLDVFLTAPGRQSGNAAELVASLSRAAQHPVRVLSTDEEGRLAYAGGVATADVRLPASVAVCDVGGASTEIAVGHPYANPTWVCSVELGSVRLSARVDGLAEARTEAARAFAGVAPPPVEAALAVGGSARAVRRLVGSWLGEAELEEALRLVQTKSPSAIARRFGVDRARARILPAGVAVLAEVQGRLGVPLHVCSGGIREGAVLASAALSAATA
jgi:exopolyphosphatase / guanosine-5'-triphosphate,3'-diphosphate pyrophosphatase